METFFEGDEVMEWQPIDTAPKDGTKVLLLTSYGVVEGFYKKFVVGEGYWDQRVVFGMGEFGDLKPPTHWMTLPPPPKDSANA